MDFKIWAALTDCNVALKMTCSLNTGNLCNTNVVTSCDNAGWN